MNKSESLSSDNTLDESFDISLKNVCDDYEKKILNEKTFEEEKYTFSSFSSATLVSPSR